MKQYDRVRVVTSRFHEKGVPEGTLGYIIEIFPGPHFEVEFSDPATGCTFAQIVVDFTDIVPDPE